MEEAVTSVSLGAAQVGASATIASPDADKKNSATLIGIGSMPLLAGEAGPGHLLPDAVYNVLVRPAFQLSVTVGAPQTMQLAPGGTLTRCGVLVDNR